jgi:2-polyprenyl-3-methyl-5-hydroxy-6-metoxy-1,4-benzoquinol methylase
MNREPDLEVETRIAHRYFASFADDYQRATEGGKTRSWLHGIVNRLFRKSTFEGRTNDVSEILAAHGLKGKTVLDLGCGPGELSVIAAQLGARVVGLDIVEEMIAFASDRASKEGVSESTTFRTANLLTDPLDDADVTMLIGVIEYYGDLDALLSRACQATRELVIIADTKGPYWRRRLRYLLARIKHFRLYYHSPDSVERTMQSHGFRLDSTIAAHSYRVMSFARKGAVGAHD